MVIGWAADDNYKTQLIEKAIGMAAGNCPLAAGAIFHSDRGSNGELHIGAVREDADVSRDTALRRPHRNML